MDTGDLIALGSLLIPVLIIAAIFFFMYRSFKRNSKFAEELRQNIAKARSATAVVLDASQGLTGGDINRIIHLKLEVHDNFGEPYEAKATWFINTLHFDKIRVGNAIMVKIDSQNKMKIYPAESWGRYTEGYENR